MLHQVTNDFERTNFAMSWPPATIEQGSFDTPELGHCLQVCNSGWHFSAEGTQKTIIPQNKSFLFSLEDKILSSLDIKVKIEN